VRVSPKSYQTAAPGITWFSACSLLVAILREINTQNCFAGLQILRKLKVAHPDFVLMRLMSSRGGMVEMMDPLWRNEEMAYGGR
jgi:hypothetical protein